MQSTQKGTIALHSACPAEKDARAKRFLGLISPRKEKAVSKMKIEKLTLGLVEALSA